MADYEDIVLLSDNRLAVKIMALWGRFYDVTIEALALLAQAPEDLVFAEVSRLTELGILLPKGELAEHAKRMLILRAKEQVEDKKQWKKNQKT